MEGNSWGLQGMSWRYQGSAELERMRGEAGGAGHQVSPERLFSGQKGS